MALTAHFSTRPFATGSLIGKRAFSVNPYGRNGPYLAGPRFPQPFGPGVNHARCVTPMMNMSILAVDAPSLWSSMPEACVERGCACGFYAYTTEGREFEAPNRMNAIIEGFGKCVVGPLGFRAGKARLLALVMPHLRGENDPYAELWEQAGPPIDGRRARALADDHKVPLFDTYTQAVEEFPITQYAGQVDI